MASPFAVPLGARDIPDRSQVLYEPQAGHDAADAELLERLEFLARVLIHIPEPNKHLVHYFGAYANRVRSTPPVRLGCRSPRVLSLLSFAIEIPIVPEIDEAR